MSDLLIKDSEGKVRFLGHDDPNNPPVRQPVKCQHGSDSCSHLQCPTCGNYFDYLLGEVKQGCETCYDPSKDIPDKKPETYDSSKEML